MLDAVPVDQADLDHVALGNPERRVHDTFDVPAYPDEGHLALGQLGTQPEAHRRRVIRRRALLRDLGDGRSGLRRGRRPLWVI